MNDIEKIKDNIRCMLNLARDDGAADGEIQNAMNFATKLMNQHNLCEADLTSVDEKILDLENAELGKAASYSQGRKTSAWEVGLAFFVCKFVGGVKYYIEGNTLAKDHLGLADFDDKGKQRVAVRYSFYGLHEDALLAKALFDEFVVTIAAMGRLKYGSVFRGEGRSYCEGFISGMREKYDEANRQEFLTAQSQVKMEINANALVVIDKRALIIKQKETLPKKYLQQKKMKLSRSGSQVGQGRYNSDATRVGIEDGRKAKVSSTKTARLSR